MPLERMSTRSLHGSPRVRSAAVLLILLLLSCCLIARLSFGPGPARSAPAFTVLTRWRDMDSYTVEREITIPLEESLGELPGAARIESVSSLHSSRVTVIFHPAAAPETLRPQLRSRVEELSRRLPSSAQHPLIVHGGSNEPPAMIISFQAAPEELPDLREEVKRCIEPRCAALPGAGRTEIGGSSREEIRIFPDAQQCAPLRLRRTDLAARAAAETKPPPAAALLYGDIRLPLLFPSPPADPAGMRLLPLFTLPGRPPLPLDQLAEVKRMRARPESVSRVNGREGVILYLYRSGNGSLIGLCRGARRLCERLTREGFDTAVLYDAGAEIESELRNVARALTVSMVAVAAVLALAARGLQRLVLTVLFLPLTAVFSLALFALLREPVHAAVLSGYAAGIGLAADSALIAASLLERHRSCSPAVILPPLLGAVLTSIAVLVPLLGAEGLSPETRGIALSLSTLLAVSCAAAAGFFPGFYRPAAHREAGGGGSVKSSRSARRRAGLLLSFTEEMIRRRRILLPLCLLAALSFPLLLLIAEKDLTGEPADGMIFGRIEFPPGTAMETVDERTAEAAGKMAALPGAVSVESRAERGAARFSLRFDPGRCHPERMRRLLHETGSAINGGSLHLSESSEKRLQIEILGDDPRQLRALARSAAGELSLLPWVEGAVLHFKDPPPTLSFRPDPGRLSSCELSMDELIILLRCHLQGPVCGKQGEDGRETDIRVIGAAARQAGVGELLQLPLLTAQGSTVRLGSLGELREEEGIGPVNRSSGSRAAAFSLHCSSSVRWAAAERRLHRFFSGSFPLPEGYGYRLDPRLAERSRELRRLRRTALLSAAAVYCILAAVSESLALPLLILLTAAPSLLPAAALLLLLFGRLHAAALTGLIIVGGLAVNNALLAADRIRTAAPSLHLLPERRRSRIIAISMADRLETLFLTTASTAAGTVPLLLLGGRSSPFVLSLGLAVLSGVAGSLAATLLFLPPLLFALPRCSRRYFAGVSSWNPADHSYPPG